MGRENGNMPATNPNEQHLLLDSVKCHCQEWEGGESRCRERDAASVWFPTMWGPGPKLKGSTSVVNTEQWCSRGFWLPSWTDHALKLCRTLSLHDSPFFGGQWQQGNDVQRTEKQVFSSPSLPCSSLRLLLPASHLVGLRKGSLKSSSSIFHCH